MKKIIFMSLISVVLLTSCSENNNHISSTEDNNSHFVTNEEEIASANEAHMTDIASEASETEKNNNIITLPITVDDNNNIIDVADVKLITSVYETEKIENFEKFGEHWQTIYNYDKYFSNDGTLKPEYVFAEITIEVFANKDWEELELTLFKLKFMSSGEYVSLEPSIVDKCIDFNNLRKTTSISVTGNQPKTVTLGYVVEKNKIENAEDTYLNASFASFDVISGSNSISLEIKNVKE